jgi:hypothetical protein
VEDIAQQSEVVDNDVDDGWSLPKGKFSSRKAANKIQKGNGRSGSVEVTCPLEEALAPSPTAFCSCSAQPYRFAAQGCALICVAANAAAELVIGPANAGAVWRVSAGASAFAAAAVGGLAGLMLLLSLGGGARGG